MGVYRFTRAATDDLLSIYLEGLEQFGVVQADRYHEGLQRIFAFLAETPRAARLREEIDPPVRAHPFRTHIIVYDETEDGDPPRASRARRLDVSARRLTRGTLRPTVLP